MLDEEQQREKQITREPEEAPPMEYRKNSSEGSSRSSSSESETTISEVGSGYQRETNECTEFCLDLFTCFGICNSICPSSENGCISSCASFFGNFCFSLCKV